MEGYEIFSNARNLYKDGSLFNKVFFRDDRDMMGADVSGTEIEIGREEEKSVLCMGHFLTSPASLIHADIFFITADFDFSFSLLFFLRMEEMVKSMMQYKTKIEQLKQEKSSLSITYEVYISVMWA